MIGRSLLVALVLTSLAVVAHADDPGAGAGGDSDDTHYIIGGQRASTCQWPTTALLDGGHFLCTAALVHPSIILTAAHCETSYSHVYFGESRTSARSVRIDHCRWYSSGDQPGPSDYGYCKLADAINDIPITPVAFGCEVDQLTVGKRAAIVGFGARENEQFGDKYLAETEIIDRSGGMVWVGRDGVGAWQGDSGGPAYAQLDDGTWRTFGIVSGGNQPGEPVGYVPMESVVAWVEANSGVDITPCFETDGSWNPSLDCQGFATNPASTGSWSNWCQDGDPVSGPSATCGTSIAPDDTPPTVAITDPKDGAVFRTDNATVRVVVSATDEGSGVGRVALEVNGTELTEKTSAPWELEGAFPAGEYELRAVAEDRRGNRAESQLVRVYVGTDATGFGPDDDDSTTGGCGCAVAGRTEFRSLLLLTAAMVGLVLRRRRRS